MFIFLLHLFATKIDESGFFFPLRWVQGPRRQNLVSHKDDIIPRVVITVYLERGEHHVEPLGNEGRHQTVPLPVLNRKTVKFGVFRQHQVYSNSAFWRQRRVFLGTWNKWELDWFMLIKCSILNVKSPSLDTVFNVSSFLKFKISFR